MAGNALMNGHTSEWLYAIFALTLSFFSNVISWVFFICVDEERYKRTIVVSQIHISMFITYYFVEEVWVVCINIPTGHPVVCLAICSRFCCVFFLDQ